MVRLHTICLLLAGFASLGVAVPSLSLNLNDSALVPGAYLIEYEDGYSQPSFLNDVSSKRVAAAIRVAIDSTLFKGASYQFDPEALGDEPIQLLSELPTVKNVWPVRRLKRPDDQVHWSGMNNAPVQLQSERGTEGYAPHVVTQVDKFHKAGITGKGIKIGIIDTGIDYLHPALGGGFGPGFLVSHGFDHVGEKLGPDGVPKPDSDPYENCHGHGTHVAGIIAAQRNELGFTGAAHGAHIGMYRVFDCLGQSTSDILMQAISRAYDDGNHIISGSLGAGNGWPYDPTTALVDRIVKEGVICVFSQANNGFMGPFYATSPSSAKNAIAVASTEGREIASVYFNASYSIKNGTTKPFDWKHGIPSNWGNVSLPLYVGTSDTANGSVSCNDFADAPDLSGFVVLIETDRNFICSDHEKLNYAVEKGAQHALFYTEGLETPYEMIFSGVDNSVLPSGVGSIQASIAQQLLALWESGKQVVLHITDPTHASVHIDTRANVWADNLSTFNSWGPSWDLDIKPDISAPGGEVLSTYPIALGSYASASGTSMAAPLISGIFALLLESRKGASISELQTLLITTANPITFVDDWNPKNYSDPAPVVLQGGGVVQAWTALQASSIPSTAKLHFNDTEHFVQSHTFSIRNTGPKDVTYYTESQAAITAFTLNAGMPNPAVSFEIEYSDQYANITFEETSIAVPAGGSADIKLFVTPPSHLDPSRLPIYSGYIKINSSIGERLSIPYLGVVGTMRTAPIINSESFTIAYSDGFGLDPASPGTTFTFPSSNSTPPSIPLLSNATRIPILIHYANLGTPVFDVELWSLKSAPSNTTDAPLDQNLGSISGFPLLWVPRSEFVQRPWDGRLRDGRAVEKGAYTLIAKALRIFGDAEVEADWDLVRGVDFWIQYA